MRALVSLRGAVFNEKISRFNPFSRENASEKTSHFHFALPYENERRRGREIHTHTERKEEEKTFRQTRVLRFTRFKETSRSRAHHHPKGTINSASAIARERVRVTNHGNERRPRPRTVPAQNPGRPRRRLRHGRHRWRRRPLVQRRV